MKIGIVGLPNVGKSTLFNSITKAGAESANYPFTTIEPNTGIAIVPDKRLEVLGKMYNTKKITPAAIEFVDIAGLVKGASKGEGLGNMFLSNIREANSIIHVVRCFEDANVVHVDGDINPVRDIETIEYELIFSDIDQIERKLPKLEKQAKADKKIFKEIEALKKALDGLTKGISARNIIFTEEEKEYIDNLFLLTMKPAIYVANIKEENIENPETNEKYNKFKEYILKKEKNAKVIPLCIKIEEEISELDGDEKEEFLEAMGMEESGLDKLIKASYDLLGLMSFLTAGEEEVRAWTIKKNTKAPDAAGKIHTDIKRGFIKAEIVSYDDLIEAGSMLKAKEKGKVRLEGKEYIMQEGDIALFRFNV